MPKNESGPTEFARRLARHMEDRGWNQSDMARAASKYLPKGQEFRRDNIHVYLTKGVIPRPKQLVAIAKALGVDPADLQDGIGHAERLPYSMKPSDEPGKAWLHVDMKVPVHVALSVLGMLGEKR